jgi:hypothetical protein
MNEVRKIPASDDADESRRFMRGLYLALAISAVMYLIAGASIATAVFLIHRVGC